MNYLSPLSVRKIRPISRDNDRVSEHLETALRLAEALHGKLEWMVKNGLYSADLRMAMLTVEDALKDLRGTLAKAEGR